MRFSETEQNGKLEWLIRKTAVCTVKIRAALRRARLLVHHSVR